MENPRLQTVLEAHFQWLHAHPELSFEEHETTKYIHKALAASGLTPLPWPLATGAAYLLEGRTAGHRVALRCDIDALPVREETGLTYASQNDGVMHACGHDFHTAALLGAAQLLAQRQAEIAGSILLLFQPAEEKAGGALKVMETGVLAGVEQIYGLHASPRHDLGTLALCEGPDHAAVDRFTITLEGTGGHAGLPHTTADPVLAAAAAVQGLQQIASRNTDPFDNVVVSVTQLHAGSTWNVIPQNALLEGTIRTLDAGTRTRVKARFVEILTATARAYGASPKIHWDTGCPATNNDPVLTQRVEALAGRLGFLPTRLRPDMGGEDFAVYQQSIPGTFFHVGVGQGAALHNPHFKVDPTPLAKTAQLLAETGIQAAAGWVVEA